MEACETRRRLRVAGFTRARYHRELGGGLFASGIINLGEKRRRRKEEEEEGGGSQEFPQEEDPLPPYTAATMSPEAVSLLLFRITCQGKSHHCSLYGPRCHFLPRRNFLLLPPLPLPLLHPLFSTRPDFPRGSAIVNKLANEQGRANFSPPDEYSSGDATRELSSN